MTGNRTERYMIIFNNLGLTIKGYYQEFITPIERKKILDRLYTLIHRELFEGLQPLEAQTTTVSNGGVTSIPTPQTTTLPLEPKVKRTYKKHKHRNKKPMPLPVNIPPEPLSTPIPEVPSGKDPFDNEKDDNQYSEFKKKGLI